MYDIVVVGAGVSSIFFVHTLLQFHHSLKVLVIEKGAPIKERICPLEKGMIKKCGNCSVCHRLSGFGGMGRSEGKYNYTNDFGGTLGEKIGKEEATRIMGKVDQILCSFGADKRPLYDTTNKILKNTISNYGLHVLSTYVRHLGYPLSIKILNQMYEYLKDKVEFKFQTNILSIQKHKHHFDIGTCKEDIQSKQMVMATGITGKEWFLQQCENLNIKMEKSRVDIGIRVEMRKDQMDYFIKDTFETKLFYKSKDFEATTYCMNPLGRVIKKHQYGLVMADGQNVKETEMPSNHLNFTLFVPKYFSTPKEALDYGKNLIQKINKDRERIVVQRLEDLKNRQRTYPKQIEDNSIQPTLQAESANLYEEIPSIYIDAILKTFEVIEKAMNQKIDKDTLLYGVDAKFYEPLVQMDKNFETECKDCFVIGDCSGVTYSLSQAAAAGIYVGEYIGKLFNDKKFKD